jgi:hypothetical protein
MNALKREALQNELTVIGQRYLKLSLLNDRATQNAQESSPIIHKRDKLSATSFMEFVRVTRRVMDKDASASANGCITVEFVHAGSDSGKFRTCQRPAAFPIVILQENIAVYDVQPPGWMSLSVNSR